MRANKSLSAFLFTAVFLLVFRLGFTSWSNVLSWDNFGYYLYLPSTFVYHDPAIQDKAWLDKILEEYKPTATFYQGVRLPDGKWVMRYPSGLAILNAPFFFVAHALAPALGYPADGFSAPYALAWVCGGLFYAILGLWFFRKILLRYFSDGVSAILLLLVVFATNLLEQMSVGNGHVHNYLFFLFALALHLCLRWHERPAGLTALATGLVAGLMAICRPTEVLFLLVPVLYGVYSAASLREKISLLFRRWYDVLLLGLGLLAGALPQIVYWYLVTGKPLFYSYDDPAVGFNFVSPWIGEFLFSYRKGWFVYTPLMLLAVAGFVFLWKKDRRLFVPALLYTILAVYVAASWSVWWYAGGSYSSRSMISAYSLLAIPLGALVEAASRRRAAMLAVGVVLLFFTYLNLFQFWQFEHGVLDRVRMTRAYYWKNFLRTRQAEGSEQLLLVHRSEEPYEYMPPDGRFGRKLLYLETFDSAKREDWHLVPDPADPANKVLRMDSAFLFTPAFEKSYNQLVKGEYAWLRVRGRVFADSSASFPLLVVHFAHGDKAYKYVTSENQSPSLEKGKWQELRIDYMIPEVRSEDDLLRVYFWNMDRTAVLVDSLCVELYEPAAR